MIVRLIKRLEDQAELTRARLGDSAIGALAQPDEQLDLRCVLDAPKMLGAEIHRLRRLVRKHGGRP